jgi:nicotinate phosphoribosyltransferase
MGPWESYATELVTDLYELTMASSYLKEGMASEATFSLFVRSYPKDRAYFVSGGIDRLLEMVAGMRFSKTSLDYLASTGKFSPDFLGYLKDFRFTGSIRAVPEGRIFFAQEPILEVTAPIIEGQIIETLVINAVQLDTLIASKASRILHSAQGRSLIDFSLRRTHGVEAGLSVARMSYIVGFEGTSNMLAGSLYGIPVFGTMAHSYVTSFESELDSFFAFARAFPENTVLLIDTYDTIRGAIKALEVARRMDAEGKRLLGVRLDSGDLVQLSKEVRRIFDDAGFGEVKILASGGLDENDIQDLLGTGAPIDIFAVGTRLGVSADAPYLDIAYKLVEFNHRPILKLSSGKKTWIGQKQVHRFYDSEGRMQEDLVDLKGEFLNEGEPLLQEVMRGGELVRARDSLRAIRERFNTDWKRLPLEYRDLQPNRNYPVKIGSSLQRLQGQTEEERRRKEIKGV